MEYILILVQEYIIFIIREMEMKVREHDSFVMIIAYPRTSAASGLILPSSIYTAGEYLLYLWCH